MGNYVMFGRDEVRVPPVCTAEIFADDNMLDCYGAAAYAVRKVGAGGRNERANEQKANEAKAKKKRLDMGKSR